MIDDAPATIAINEVTRKLEIRNYINSDTSKFDAVILTMQNITIIMIETKMWPRAPMIKSYSADL